MLWTTFSKRVSDGCDAFKPGIFLALAACAAMPAFAQGLPPPPASPLPVWSYEYDAQGNLTASTQGARDAMSTSRFVYDALSRIRLGSDGSGSSFFNYVGGHAEVIEVQDPRRLITSYHRDGFGQTLTLNSPDTGGATLTYDAAGNLKTRYDSRGVLSSYFYDPLNRLVNESYAWGSMPLMVVNWRYDEVGMDFGYGIGRLTSTNYPGGGSRHAYDAQGRIVQSLQRTETGGGAAITLATRYGFDNAGALRSITYPSGYILSIDHSGGLPVGLNLLAPASQSSTALLAGIVYEPFGVPCGWSWILDGQVQRHDRVFDTAGRMVRYPIGGFIRDITYNAANQAVSYTHFDRVSGAKTAAAMALNQAFTYDHLARIVGVQRPTGNSTYDYDASGNRVSGTVGGVTVGYSVSSTSNRVTGISKGNRNLSYDAAGNTISDVGSTLIWSAGYDLANRLATLTINQLGKPQATTGYSYNAFGQRVAKLTISQSPSGGTAPSGPPGGALIFVYDTDGRLIGEYSAVDSRPWREYVWLGDIPVAVIVFDPQVSGGAIYYIHADHLNTPRVVLDRTGKERWTWLGEPFGTDAPNERPAGLGNLIFNLRMPGQYFDVESGLVYNYRRHYDPTLGRYTQSDPIGLAGGINTYAYVGGNPVSNVDPEGLWSVTFGAYGSPLGIGPGAQVTFGSANGNGFMTVRVGIGIGGGFSYNPNGGLPGEAPNDPSKGGIVAACSANASFNAGPLQAAATLGGARNYNNSNSSMLSPFSANGRFSNGWLGGGSIWNLNANANIGAQITIYSGKP